MLPVLVALELPASPSFFFSVIYPPAGIKDVNES
jgi:hypothetical protein